MDELQASAHLWHRGRVLEAITVSWNVIGTVDLSIAAIGARSVALAGLGSTASF